MNSQGSSFPLQEGWWPPDIQKDEWLVSGLIERNRGKGLMGLMEIENTKNNEGMFYFGSGEENKNWNLSKVMARSYLVNTIMEEKKGNELEIEQKEELEPQVQNKGKRSNIQTLRRGIKRKNESEGGQDNFQNTELQQDEETNSSKKKKSKSISFSQSIQKSQQIKLNNKEDNQTISFPSKISEKAQQSNSSNRSNDNIKESFFNNANKTAANNQIYRKSQNSSLSIIEEKNRFRSVQQNLDKTHNNEISQRLININFLPGKQSQIKNNSLPQQMQSTKSIFPGVKSPSTYAPATSASQTFLPSNLNQSVGKSKPDLFPGFLNNATTKNRKYVMKADSSSKRSQTEKDQDSFKPFENKYFQILPIKNNEDEQKRMPYFNPSERVMTEPNSVPSMNKTQENFKVRNISDQMKRISSGNSKRISKTNVTNQSDDQEDNTNYPQQIMPFFKGRGKFEEQKPIENLKFNADGEGRVPKNQIIMSSRKDQDSKIRNQNSWKEDISDKVAKEQEHLTEKNKELKKIMEQIKEREQRIESEQRKLKELEEMTIRDKSQLENRVKEERERIQEEVRAKNQQEQVQREKQYQQMQEKLKVLEQQNIIIQQNKLNEEAVRQQQEQIHKEQLALNKQKELDELKKYFEEENKKRELELQKKLQQSKEEEINRMKKQLELSSQQSLKQELLKQQQEFQIKHQQEQSQLRQQLEQQEQKQQQLLEQHEQQLQYQQLKQQQQQQEEQQQLQLQQKQKQQQQEQQNQKFQQQKLEQQQQQQEQSSNLPNEKVEAGKSQQKQPEELKKGDELTHKVSNSEISNQLSQQNNPKRAEFAINKQQKSSDHLIQQDEKSKKSNVPQILVTSIADISQSEGKFEKDDNKNNSNNKIDPDDNQNNNNHLNNINSSKSYENKEEHQESRARGERDEEEEETKLQSIASFLRKPNSGSQSSNEENKSTETATFPYPPNLASKQSSLQLHLNHHENENLLQSQTEKQPIHNHYKEEEKDGDGSEEEDQKNSKKRISPAILFKRAYSSSDNMDAQDKKQDNDDEDENENKRNATEITNTNNQNGSEPNVGSKGKIQQLILKKKSNDLSQDLTPASKQGTVIINIVPPDNATPTKLTWRNPNMEIQPKLQFKQQLLNEIKNNSFEEVQDSSIQNDNNSNANNNENSNMNNNANNNSNNNTNSNSNNIFNSQFTFQNINNSLQSIDSKIQSQNSVIVNIISPENSSADNNAELIQNQDTQNAQKQQSQNMPNNVQTLTNVKSLPTQSCTTPTKNITKGAESGSGSQRILRSVKSSDDSFGFNSPLVTSPTIHKSKLTGVEGEIKQKKNSAKSNIPKLDQLMLLPRRPSEELGEKSSRRESVLTHEQMKQFKKKKTLAKASVSGLPLNSGGFLEREDPLIQEIYGEKGNSEEEQEDDSSYFNFNKQSQYFTDFTKFQAEVDDQVHFNKQFQQDAVDAFNQAKVEDQKQDTVFQKNVKTLFRKVNQYFKAKYHLEVAVQSQGSSANASNNISGNASPITDPNLFQKQNDFNQAAKQAEEEHENIKSASLQKSDIEKLHEKLMKTNGEKTGLLGKLISNKIDEQQLPHLSQKEISETSEKENESKQPKENKLRKSTKIVIQVNPPTEEGQPQIKLDFAAIKKKNATTYKFVLDEQQDQNQIKDIEGEESTQKKKEIKQSFSLSNSSNDMTTSISVIGNQINTTAAKQFDFINSSFDSLWDESEQVNSPIKNPSTYNVAGNLSTAFSIRKKEMSSMISKIAQSIQAAPLNHQSSSQGEQFQENYTKPLHSTLRFMNHNTWKFVKNYQISYLEKQIDKGFIIKVSKLPIFLINLINRVDPSGTCKFQRMISSTSDTKYWQEKEDNQVMAQVLIKELSIHSHFEDSRNQQILLNSSEKQLTLCQHHFQKDFVNSHGMGDRKRVISDNSQSEEESNSSYSNLEDDDEKNVLGDGDKELTERNLFLQDEEDFEAQRSQYLLLSGYLEPSNIFESSNMFKQMNDLIVPVLSGIDNEFINQILKPKSSQTSSCEVVINKQNLENKINIINGLVGELDFHSKQLDMKNITMEFNDLIEGDFQDSVSLDHQFFKAEYLKLQKQLFNKFMQIELDKKRRIIQYQQLQLQQQQQQLQILQQYSNRTRGDRSPTSGTAEIQDYSKRHPQQIRNQSQLQTQQQPQLQYPQTQGGSAQASYLPSSLAQQHQQQQQLLQQQQQQQQQQLLLQQQQQQQQQQHQANFVHGQAATLSKQQQPQLQVNYNIVQQSTLPASSSLNLAPSSSAFSISKQLPSENQTSPNTSGQNPHIKSTQGRAFTQSLKSFSHQQGAQQSNLPQRSEPLFKSQTNIRTEDQKVITKSDAMIQSVSYSYYNKTSTLQSQQSIFNQSESLKVAVSGQDNAKQNKQEFMFQKTNTNQSTDEHQLTAPSPSQISKKDIQQSYIYRKRQTFNTDMSQPLQQTSLTTSHNFSHQQQSDHKNSRSNSGNQPSPPSHISISSPIQIPGQQQLIKINNQSNQIGGEQIPNKNPQKIKMPEQNSKTYSKKNTMRDTPQIPFPVLSLPPQPSSFQAYQSNPIHNIGTNINNKSNMTPEEINSMRRIQMKKPQQLEKEIQIKSKNLESLTSGKDLDKNTSMERQNLVMRTRIQQNAKRMQLSQAEQVFSAIKENNLHEIEDLLNQFHSISLEEKDEEGNTFIIVAAQVGSPEIIEYLLQKGANINAQNNDGDTALHKANFFQNHQVADILIQSGAEQNKQNNLGLNPWG